MTEPLRRPVAIALDLLVQAGRLKVSNRTDAAAGLIARRSAEVLERLGYAHLIEIVAVPTDAGRAAAEQGVQVQPRRHEHGTHACYVLDGCRCTPCTAANRDYEAARNRDTIQGRPRTVDAGPVRAHVRELMCDGPRGANFGGVGLKQIAKVSGISHGALWRLMYGAPDRAGPSKRVRSATAERLLAVTREHMADGACVPAEGTWRRIDDMLAGGWSKVAIGRHVHGPHAKALQIGRRAVTVRNARTVAALHAAWKAGEIPTEGKRSRYDRGGADVA